ncbi:hypothetical protein ACLOJK_035295 [Asimina triloba]
METKLFEATVMGDAASLRGWLEKDTLLLDRASVDGNTPLHIAILYGHVEFAETILRSRPQLASALDSAQHSPLYLASMKGHAEIVKRLLDIDPAMCLARDQDGMTPLHAAALKGRVDVVKEIVRANGTASRVLSNTREPILHMCVKHNRFDVAKALLECVNDDHEFVKMKDDDDNTILHVAVAKKHIMLTEFLLEKTMMKEEVNAMNVHGLTALDVLLQNDSKSSNHIKLVGILRSNKAKKGREILPLPKDNWMVEPSIPRKEEHLDWLNDTRSTLMIVATLIATVSFQLGVNPPGGVWQEDDKQSKYSHYAGESIMSDKYPRRYKSFTIFNSIGFLSSSLIILLLISGFSLKRRIFMWALRIITWMAVSSMIVSYGQAYFVVTTADVLSYFKILEDVTVGKAKQPVRAFSWFVPLGLLFAGHIVHKVACWCFKICSMNFRNKVDPVDQGNENSHKTDNTLLRPLKRHVMVG